MEGIEGDEYEYKTYFVHMPIQCKMYILSFLPQKSRQMVRGVCRQWKEIVDEMPCAVVNNENYKRTTQLTDVYIVKVQNFTTEYESVVKFKHTIRRLEFWDIVISYNLFHLLQECPGVLELVFENLTLESHKKMKCPDGLTLSEVKVITVLTKGYDTFRVQEFILFGLLRQIKFLKLEQVNILKPRNQYHQVVGELVNLPKIELPFGIKSSAGLVGFLIENAKTVKKFKVDALQFRPFECQIEDIMGQIDQLQFEEMTCDFLDVRESPLIEYQQHLKEIEIIVSRHFWPNLAKAVQANSSTLIKIVICYQTWRIQNLPQFQLIDASVFRDCSKLETLHCWNSHPILNLTSLPDFIQNLMLQAEFTPEDLLGIASKLRHLRMVELHQICDKYDETMFFNNKIIEAFLGIETLVGLYAILFRGTEEDITSVSNSQNAFEFFHDIDDSMMFLEIWTSRESPLRPTIIPVHVRRTHV